MYIEDFLNEIKTPRTGKVIGREEEKTIEASKFFNMILGEIPFEGDMIFEPANLRLITKLLKSFTDKSAISELPAQIRNNYEKTKEEYDKIIPKSTIRKAIRISDLIDKKDSGKKLKENEKEAVMEFAHDIYDALFQEEAKRSILNPARRSKEERMDSFYSLMPIKYLKHEQATPHYGVIIPSQSGGTIHWAGQPFGEPGDSEYFLDPKTPKDIRRSLPLVNKKVAKTASVKELSNVGRVTWDDSDSAKDKVAKALESAGATIDVTKEGKINKNWPSAKGQADIRGYTDAMKSVKFWKAIKSMI